MSNKKGPQKFGRSGTALDPSHDSSKSVASDDSECAIATQVADAAGHDEIAGAGPLDGTESPAPNIVYDSGWTTRNGFKVRVQWHGVSDDGRQRRWFRDILFRQINAVSND